MEIHAKADLEIGATLRVFQQPVMGVLHPANPSRPISLLLYSNDCMWALNRLPEFNRAYHSTDATWTSADAAASLQFPQGLLFSFVLVTPFWTAVGVALHRLIK